MSLKNSKVLINPRLISVLFLGFASGLPLTLTGSTMQAWFTEAGVDIVTIGALTLLGIPYTLKFIWAPLMDHFSLPLLGKRRGWIACTQIGLVISLCILANMDPGRNASIMGIVALMVAFCSASQDIAIDAYRTDVLHTMERGLGAAYFVFAYRVALLFSGGLALVFADYIGWKFTYYMMAVLVFLSMVVAYLSPKVKEEAISGNFFKTMSASVQSLLQQDKILMMLLFIVLYKVGDALALSLMTNFLLHGLGFSLTEVGLAYKFTAFLATVLGAFVGGVILTRWSLFRGLLFFGVAQAFSNLMFVLLAVAGKSFMLMASAIFIENFCSGLSTAALLALMMALCDHRYTAAQYALLSAIASLGRVFLGPLAGWMVLNLGWVSFFTWSFLLSFPGLIILMLVKDRVSCHAHAFANS